MPEGLLAYGYPALLANAMLAATLIPLSSEALLLAMALSGQYALAGLWGTATLGNVVGAVINWSLGRWLLHYQARPWFPFSVAETDRAGARFQRFGGWTLFFSWLPVVGDPLTFVAGTLRYPLLPFLAWVTLGKAARYGAVLWLAA